MAVVEILKVIQTPTEINMKYSRLLQWGRLLIALVILTFLIKRFAGLIEVLEVESVSFHPFWLLMSLGTLLSYRTLLVYPWRMLYCSATDLPVSFQASWTLFQLSQFGKYLPGKVGQFVGIIALCRPLGISKTAAVVSTVQDLAFQCVLGASLGIPILLSSSANHFLHNWVSVFRQNAVLLSVIAVAILGGTCIFLFHLRNKVLFRKMGSLQKGLRALFSVSEIRRLLTVYLMLWSYFGIAFFLFVKSIHPIPFGYLFMVTSIYALAWSIGFLSLVTPGGLGVREGFLSVLLALCLPPATATLVALLSRVWMMSAEILLASVAWGFYCRQKCKNAINEGIDNQ